MINNSTTRCIVISTLPSIQWIRVGPITNSLCLECRKKNQRVARAKAMRTSKEVMIDTNSNKCSNNNSNKCSNNNSSYKLNKCRLKGLKSSHRESISTIRSNRQWQPITHSKRRKLINTSLWTGIRYQVWSLASQSTSNSSWDIGLQCLSPLTMSRRDSQTNRLCLMKRHQKPMKNRSFKINRRECIEWNRMRGKGTIIRTCRRVLWARTLTFTHRNSISRVKPMLWLALPRYWMVISRPIRGASSLMTSMTCRVVPFQTTLKLKTWEACSRKHPTKPKSQASRNPNSTTLPWKTKTRSLIMSNKSKSCRIIIPWLKCLLRATMTWKYRPLTRPSTPTT